MNAQPEKITTKFLSYKTITFFLSCVLQPLSSNSKATDIEESRKRVSSAHVYLYHFHINVDWNWTSKRLKINSYYRLSSHFGNYQPFTSSWSFLTRKPAPYICPTSIPGVSLSDRARVLENEWWHIGTSRNNDRYRSLTAAVLSREKKRERERWPSSSARECGYTTRVQILSLIPLHSFETPRKRKQAGTDAVHRWTTRAYVSWRASFS